MQTEFVQPQASGLTVIGTATKRHWALILIMLMIGLAVGALMAGRPDRVYSASTKILIDPLSGNPFSPDSLERRGDPLQDVGTEAVLVATPAVAKVALGKAPGIDVGEVNKSVSGVATPNTQIIEITFTGPTQAKAREGADAMANAYLEYRSQQWAKYQENRLTSIKQQRTALTASIDAATATLEDKKTAAREKETLARVISSYQSRIATLSTEASVIRGGEPIPGQVIASASTPTRPDGLGAPLSLALGGLTGLLLGLALAVWREVSDTRLRAPSDVEACGLPVIASLGVGPDADSVADAYKRLRTAVTQGPSRRSIVSLSSITQAVDSVPYSLGLARSLVRFGATVTLVLAEPPRATKHSGGEASAEPSSLPAPRLLELPDGLRLVDVSASQQWFGTRDFQVLLDRLSQATDHVVIATPWVNSTDGAVLCTSADVSILVVPSGVTEVSQLERAADTLSLYSVHLLGCLVDMTTAGRGGLERAEEEEARVRDEFRTSALTSQTTLDAVDPEVWTEHSDAGPAH